MILLDSASFDIFIFRPAQYASKNSDVITCKATRTQIGHGQTFIYYFGYHKVFEHIVEIVFVIGFVKF